MKSGREECFSRAMRLLDDGHAKDVLERGNDLISSEDEADRLSGYLCRGLAHEDGVRIFSRIRKKTSTTIARRV